MLYCTYNLLKAFSSIYLVFFSTLILRCTDKYISNRLWTFSSILFLIRSSIIILVFDNHIPRTKLNNTKNLTCDRKVTSRASPASSVAACSLCHVVLLGLGSPVRGRLQVGELPSVGNRTSVSQPATSHFKHTVRRLNIAYTWHIFTVGPNVFRHYSRSLYFAFCWPCILVWSL